jgi:hypothetical protein
MFEWLSCQIPLRCLWGNVLQNFLLRVYWVQHLFWITIEPKGWFLNASLSPVVVLAVNWSNIPREKSVGSMNMADMNQELELGIVDKNKLEHRVIWQSNSPILISLFVKPSLDLVCQYAAEHCTSSFIYLHLFMIYLMFLSVSQDLQNTMVWRKVNLPTPIIGRRTEHFAQALKFNRLLSGSGRVSCWSRHLLLVSWDSSRSFSVHACKCRNKEVKLFPFLSN